MDLKVRNRKGVGRCGSKKVKKKTPHVILGEEKHIMANPNIFHLCAVSSKMSYSTKKLAPP